MDGEAWRAATHGVTKSQTRLGNSTTTTQIQRGMHPEFQLTNTCCVVKIVVGAFTKLLMMEAYTYSVHNLTQYP